MYASEVSIEVSVKGGASGTSTIEVNGKSA